MSKTVTVTGSSLSIDAAYVSDTIPSTMNAGQIYNVVVAMKNTGTMVSSEADTSGSAPSVTMPGRPPCSVRMVCKFLPAPQLHQGRRMISLSP